jgi:Acetyltransferase (GNAT) family
LTPHRTGETIPVVRYVKVDVRELREEDRPRLLALAGEAFGAGLGAGETVAVLTRCHVLVAETREEVAGERELAGYVALVDSGGAMHIRQLLVAPAHGEEHVERQLCDWAEGYAMSRGFERVCVDVGEDELRARVFYAGRGYVPGEDGLELLLPHP